MTFNSDLTAPKWGDSYSCVEEEYAQKCEISVTFYFRFIGLYGIVREKAYRLNKEMSIQLHTINYLLKDKDLRSKCNDNYNLIDNYH